MGFYLPKPDEHTAIVGRNGTGKTQFGFWIFSQRDLKNNINFIIDYKGDDLINSLERVRPFEPHWKLPTENGVYHIRPDVEDDDAMRDFFRRVRRTGNMGLFADEGYMIPGEKKGPFQALLTQGRSLKIPIITLSQRPVEINRFVFSEAGHIIIFDLNDERDQDTVKMFTPKGFMDWVPDEFAGEERLPNFHAKWYNIKSNERFVLRPCPSAEEIIETIDAQLQVKHKWM